MEKLLRNVLNLLVRLKPIRTTGTSGKPLVTGIHSKMATLDNGINFGNVSTHILSQLDGHKFRSSVEEHLQVVKSKFNNKSDLDDAERWLSWAKKENYLKVVSTEIPHGILPAEYKGNLSDVKVFVKYGPDDPVYDNNKTIRERVARGNSFLEITNKVPQTTCVLQAMKKFTGGLGDDDDRDGGDDLIWKRYFTKPLEETDFIISTSKANGEAAHLSCVEIAGEFVMCGGSKNVHMMFKTKADVGRYTEPRYRVAREVCEAVVDGIDRMDPDTKHRFLSFLVASRYTAVFEILVPGHQHVVNLSHLKKPELKFIAWTKTDLQAKGDMQNVIPPHIGIEIARCLGLDTVGYDVVQMEQLDEKIVQIRQGYNIEGEVLYFIDKTGCVIGLLKKKSVWYVMCRAVREKAKTACSRSAKDSYLFSKQKSIDQLEKRVREIQRWLKIDDKTTQQWKELGVGFLKWVLSELEENHISQDEVRDLFPVCWDKYLAQNKVTDKIDVTFDNKETVMDKQQSGACGS